MDEGKLWSLIRNVLTQGGAIQLDRASMSSYEEYSARLDAAAAERVADFTKLADARIAELERDIERLDAQWRDELRIYREADGARIAELESALLVERERICAAIKATDDAASACDYMLDSDDCIAVVRGELGPANYEDAARANGGES